jgi:Fe-S cluster biosynthesis and repair protein YggX
VTCAAHELSGCRKAGIKGTRAGNCQRNLAKVAASSLVVDRTSRYFPSARGNFMARTVQCIKLGKQAEGLDFPPYPGELGKRIYENVSKEAWAQWLKQQTMLVNENRLNLADQRARQYLARQMENHFFGQGADVAQGYVPPSE